MKVRCITLDPPGFQGGGWFAGCKIKVGGIYDVVDIVELDGTWYELSHHLGVCYISELFEKCEPYSNSVSKELAEQAMKTPIEIDQPVKQLEQAN